MIKRIFFFIGVVWSSPVTFFGLVYALLCTALKWYSWHGFVDGVAVFLLEENRCPAWLLNLWKNWGGHAVGNVIVMRWKPEVRQRLFQHELVHVKQVMILGVFHPFLYALFSLIIKIACKHSHPYGDNPFEIDARRATGDSVDINSKLKF